MRTYLPRLGCYGNMLPFSGYVGRRPDDGAGNGRGPATLAGPAAGVVCVLLVVTSIGRRRGRNNNDTRYNSNNNNSRTTAVLVNNRNRTSLRNPKDAADSNTVAHGAPLRWLLLTV